MPVTTLPACHCTSRGTPTLSENIFIEVCGAMLCQYLDSVAGGYDSSDVELRGQLFVFEIEERSLVAAEIRPRFCRDNNDKRGERRSGGWRSEDRRYKGGGCAGCWSCFYKTFHPSEERRMGHSAMD